MSSHSDEQIICPNCGTPAHGNYCSQCGQETHLHNDTFWGLVLHFIGHYFHYDSKFWKTMRALLLNPGKLTLAYIDRQRMRYIPPISLYIFISAVYFLISYNLKNGKFFPIKQPKASVLRKIAAELDSLDGYNDTVADQKKKNHLKWSLDTTGGEAKLTTIVKEDSTSHTERDTVKNDTSFDAVNRYFESKKKKIEKEHKRDIGEYMKEQMDHNFPKLFFFMIPALAFILRLLYMRRKSITFVHHTVFAIHYHSFWFSLNLLTKIGISNPISSLCKLAFYTSAFIYMVAALKKVFQSSTRRAIVYTILIATGYGIVFGIAALAAMGLILAFA